MRGAGVLRRSGRSNREDPKANGANGCRWILVASPRIGAERPALPRRTVCACRWLLILIGCAAAGALQERSGQGRGDVSAAGGYARLVIKLADEVDSEVTTAGTILVIRFKHPVDVPVDDLADAVPDYVGVGAARSRRHGDPAVAVAPGHHQHHDGRRADLRRPVTRQLGRRAAEPAAGGDQGIVRAGACCRTRASRAARRRGAKKRPPIRVRASVQPTFVRFVFEMPDGVSVSSVLNEQKLTLLFNAVLKFDLADAKIAAPAQYRLDQPEDIGEQSAVEIVLIGDVDVHSFREDRNYNVDVSFQPVERPAAQLPAATVAAAALAPALAAATPAEPVAAAPLATAPAKAVQPKLP